MISIGLAIFLLFGACGSLATVQDGSILISNGKYKFEKGRVPGAVAYGIYNDSIQETGWGVFDVKATSVGGKYAGDQIMYAAGMLEGALTSLRIYQQYQNLGGFIFDNRPSDTYQRLCKFFKQQEVWMKGMIVKYQNHRFWQSVGFIQSQLEGLYAGYSLTGENEMQMCQLQILSGVGDIIDLLHVFNRTTLKEYLQMPPKVLRSYAQRNGHCSALVKVTPGFENIFMGHSSWFEYSSMLRIYKHYDLRVFGDDNLNSKLSFSSYPGFLNSLDDFYILGSGMVMLQTTNNIFNSTLYDKVTPESLLAWYRVRVANLLSNNARDWGEFMKMYNSGTYNNQYMVMDLKKFHPKVSIDDGAFYVVEQIPGLVESRDQTVILREGYWASYNVPFYEDIFEKSGYGEVSKHDPTQTHALAPRAKIFRRDESTVVDMESMKRILRSNNYKFDKYSDNDACNAICCRGDLSLHYSLAGCYDTKVTDFQNALDFTSHALSGPTVGGQSQIPPFTWKPDMPHHEGMPDVYNFPFVVMKPKQV